MFLPKTKLLTSKNVVQINKLSGQEELCSFSSSQSLAFHKAFGFKLAHSKNKLTKIETPNRSLTLTPDSPVITTFSKNRKQYFDLLLIEHTGYGAALGIVSNFPNMLKNGLFRYQLSKADSEKSGYEKYWILNRYTTRNAAKHNLHFLACKYSLPISQLCKGWQGIEREQLSEVFSQIDTISKLNEIKNDFDCPPESAPHMSVRTLNEFTCSRSFFLTLEIYKKKEGHILTINHLSQASKNREHILNPVPTEKLTFLKIVDAINYIDENFKGTYVDIQYSIYINDQSYYIVPASWLKVGMEIPVVKQLTDNEMNTQTSDVKVIIEKKHIEKIGQVQSPELLYRILCDEQATLIANNILIPSNLTKWW